MGHTTFMLCLLLLGLVQLTVQCEPTWTYHKDVWTNQHALQNQYNIATLDECKQYCLSFNRCIAVEFDHWAAEAPDHMCFIHRSNRTISKLLPHTGTDVYLLTRCAHTTAPQSTSESLRSQTAFQTTSIGGATNVTPTVYIATTTDKNDNIEASTDSGTFTTDHVKNLDVTSSNPYVEVTTEFVEKQGSTSEQPVYKTTHQTSPRVITSDDGDIIAEVTTDVLYISTHGDAVATNQRETTKSQTTQRSRTEPPPKKSPTTPPGTTEYENHEHGDPGFGMAEAGALNIGAGTTGGIVSGVLIIGAIVVFMTFLRYRRRRRDVDRSPAGDSHGNPLYDYRGADPPPALPATDNLDYVFPSRNYFRRTSSTAALLPIQNTPLSPPYGACPPPPPPPDIVKQPLEEMEDKEEPIYEKIGEYCHKMPDESTEVTVEQKL